MDSTEIDEIWEDDFGIVGTPVIGTISSTISSSISSNYGRGERQAVATEIIKGMVSSGLVESPEDMAKEAVKIADALLAELNK